MQTKSKQRVMGATIIFILLAITLSILFSHPLPGLSTNKSMPATAQQNDGQLVYDLNLQPAVNVEAASEEDELVPLHPLTEAEMRARAAATSTVSEKLLRTSASPMVIAEKLKENLKDSAEQEEETLSELKHEDKVATTPAVAKEAVAELVPNSTRDLKPKRVSSEAVPLAWVVQLGSFSDKQNAMHLVEVLRGMNLDVYTRNVGSAENTIIKVYVGPYIEKKDVQKAQRDLEQQLNLKGVVKKYSLS